MSHVYRSAMLTGWDKAIGRRSDQHELVTGGVLYCSQISPDFAKAERGLMSEKSMGHCFGNVQPCPVLHGLASWQGEFLDADVKPSHGFATFPPGIAALII